MAVTERVSERMVRLGGINPASYTSEQNSGYVSLANYHRAMIYINAGVLGQDLDIDIEEGLNTSGGTPQTHDAGSKDTTLIATTDNNAKIMIEIRPEELDIADGYHCINVEVTPAGSSSIFAVDIFGVDPRFEPVPTTALHEVVD